MMKQKTIQKPSGRSVYSNHSHGVILPRGEAVELTVHFLYKLDTERQEERMGAVGREVYHEVNGRHFLAGNGRFARGGHSMNAGIVPEIYLCANGREDVMGGTCRACQVLLRHKGREGYRSSAGSAVDGGRNRGVERGAEGTVRIELKALKEAQFPFEHGALASEVEGVGFNDPVENTGHPVAHIAVGHLAEHRIECIAEQLAGGRGSPEFLPVFPGADEGRIVLQALYIYTTFGPHAVAVFCFVEGDVSGGTFYGNNTCLSRHNFKINKLKQRGPLHRQTREAFALISDWFVITLRNYRTRKTRTNNLAGFAGLCRNYVFNPQIWSVYSQKELSSIRGM